MGSLGLEVNLFKLGGLGHAFTPSEPVTHSYGMGDIDTGYDYGIAARRAVSERRRDERLTRALDTQDAAKRFAERERTLAISQEALQQAGATQEQILSTGATNLGTVLRSTMTISVLALFAFGATKVLANMTTPAKRSRARSFTA